MAHAILGSRWRCDPNDYFGATDRADWKEVAIAPMPYGQIAPFVADLLEGGPACRADSFARCTAGL